MATAGLRPTLRDGVEIFIKEEKQGDGICHIVFLFLSTRRRIKIRCIKRLANLIRTLAEERNDFPLPVLQDRETQAFLNFLAKNGIISTADPLATPLLPAAYVERYKRQIYFLIDSLYSADKAMSAQKRIFDARIAIFGLGGIGSQILLQLCMAGFRKFTLVDYGRISKTDMSRTPYHIPCDMNLPKVTAAARLAQRFAYESETRCHDLPLDTKLDLHGTLYDADYIVNAADEPYIGYTNIRLSRYALKHGLPMLAAGGFDAHLGALGETLIPFVTPCADCYASYFKTALKDWKPAAHPVKQRSGWFGGLSGLAAFSAASGVLQIIAYVAALRDPAAFNHGRAEFLFHDYSLSSFSVERDPCCPACGANENAHL